MWFNCRKTQIAHHPSPKTGKHSDRNRKKETESEKDEICQYLQSDLIYRKFKICTLSQLNETNQLLLWGQRERDREAATSRKRKETETEKRQREDDGEGKGKERDGVRDRHSSNSSPSCSCSPTTAGSPGPTQQLSERLRAFSTPKATSGAFHHLSVPFRLVLPRETESKGPQGARVRVTKRLP